MVWVLKKGASKEEIAEIENGLSKESSSGFDAKKFNGILKIEGDALELQKKLRDEWERNVD